MVDLKLALPEGCLEPEERSGYPVSREMKEVWAVELDLLVRLLDVCRRHDIPIFASGGTMLGAVRHQGFIPWDDDIDMMMLREDYDRLCAVAETEFQYPYFFQTEYTDHGSLRGHAQLRNSETTAILLKERDRHFRFNQGIFIDIFPLDAVTDDEAAFARQERDAQRYKKRAKTYARLSTRYRAKPGVKGAVKAVLHRCCSALFETLEVCAYQRFEETCSRYNHTATARISTLSFQFSNRQHFKYRADYAQLIELPFEFITLPVGKQYDHALTCRYGDYLSPVTGSSVHGDVIFDTDRPYTERIMSSEETL